MEAPKLVKVYSGNKLLKMFWCKTIDVTERSFICYGVPLKSGKGETDVYFWGTCYFETEPDAKSAFVLLSEPNINIRITW